MPTSPILPKMVKYVEINGNVRPFLRRPPEFPLIHLPDNFRVVRHPLTRIGKPLIIQLRSIRVPGDPDIDRRLLAILIFYLPISFVGSRQRVNLLLSQFNSGNAGADEVRIDL